MDVEINFYLRDLSVEKSHTDIWDSRFRIDTGIKTISSDALRGFVMCLLLYLKE